MHKSSLYFIALLSFICWPIAVMASDLRVGPIYTDKLPKIEIVIDTINSGEKFSAQDIVLLEDGQATVKPDFVQLFDQTAREMAIVLVVDVSGSMAGKPIENIKKALIEFAGKAEKIKIAIVTFADDVRVEANFGVSSQELSTAINNINARGRSTELYKGIFKAFSLFDAPNLPARQRLVVISDGKDEGTAYKLDDVINQAKRNNIAVDTIGFTQVDTKYLSVLERLANLSGGNYAYAQKSEELDKLFSQGISTLKNSPVATFSPRVLIGDGQEHKVGIRVQLGDRYITNEQKVILMQVAGPTPRLAKEKPTKDNWLLSLGLSVLFLLFLFTFVAMKYLKKRKSVEPINTTPDNQEQNSLQQNGSDTLSIPSPSPLHLLETPPEVFVTMPMTENVKTKIPDNIPQGEKKPQTPKPSAPKTSFRTEFLPPSLGKPSAMLIIVGGPASGSFAPIEIDPFWVGAEKGNTLQISGDNLLSSSHACIRFHEGSLFLYDNKSTNGTFLNEERLKDTPRPISPGDKIRLGNTIVTLEMSKK